MKTQFINSFQKSPSLHDENAAMEERLWGYIDGFSSVEEKSFIEKLLADNAELCSKYHELLDVHQLMHEATELEQPSLRFTQNVMEQIAQYQISPAAKNYINKNIIYGIAAFFFTIIIAFLIYGFSQVNWSEASTTGTSFGYDFSKINFSKMFTNTYMNIFMMINIVVGLMLFDRYLASRRNEWKKVQH